MINRRNGRDVAAEGASGRERLIWMIAFGAGLALSVIFNIGPAQHPQTKRGGVNTNDSEMASLPSSTTVADSRLISGERRNHLD